MSYIIQKAYDARILTFIFI